MVATSEGGVGRFDIGRVIQNTFGVVGRNFRGLTLLSIVLLGLPNGVLSFAQISWFQLSGGEVPVMPGMDAFVLAFAGYVIGWSLLQAVTVRISVADLNGEQANALDELRRSIPVILPVIGLAIVSSVGIMFGAAFLVIPGLILMAIWSVAMPVNVVERPGVFASLTRSRNLTRGYRWLIFALILIYSVAHLVVSGIIGGISGAVGLALGGSLAIAALISSVITTTFGGIVSTVGIAAIYCELRLVKEGAGAADLASIFD